MVNVTNFLDLKGLLVNEMFGDVVLFIFVLAALIVFFALKNNVPVQGIIALLLLFGGVIVGQVIGTGGGLAIIWIIVVLVPTLILYFYVTRVVRKA